PPSPRPSSPSPTRRPSDLRLHEGLRHRHLEAHLFAEFEHQVGAAVVLVQLDLPAVPAHPTDRDTGDAGAEQRRLHLGQALGANEDRKSTRLNSSHQIISYA